MVTGEDRIEDVQQAAAPVILFQGAGLKSSSAAVVSAQEDEEFDYAFSHGSREVRATHTTLDVKCSKTLSESCKAMRTAPYSASV